MHLIKGSGDGCNSNLNWVSLVPDDLQVACL